MSPNHKDQTNLYNWKKISQGKSVSCALCIFLLCSSLKWNKEYPKAICHFGSENTEAEEKKLPSMGFLFFPQVAYFEIFSNKFGSTLRRRLRLVPHTSDLTCSPLLARQLLLSPSQPTPTVQDRSIHWCPVDQSLQGMLGLPFLSDFSSEDRDAGDYQKRQLLFSKAFFSTGQVVQDRPHGFK